MMSEEKILYIVRGLPGSGKSTMCKERVKSDGGYICSADDFFLDSNGIYKYDAKKISEAHLSCREKSNKLMDKGEGPVYIDNTNTTKNEARPYFQYAKQKGYTIIVIEPQTPWRFDVDMCFLKNTKNVPRDIIQSMYNRWEKEFDEESILKKVTDKNFNMKKKIFFK